MSKQVINSKNAILAFLDDEAGAVTVDWVVLTAAVVGVGLALFTQLTPLIFEQGGQAIASGIQTAAARP